MKTVLITGANGGLGTALANYFLEFTDYLVILNYHHHNENVNIYKQKYNSRVILLPGNISNLDDVAKMYEQLKVSGIELDYLINNAGIDIVSPLEEKTVDTFLKIFKVNTLGVFLMTKVFGSEIDKNKGSIVNISSDNTMGEHDPVTMEYDVSKAGVNMLTLDFAKYYSHAKVNAICFGWLDTPMNKEFADVLEYLNFVPIEKAVKEVIELLNSGETGKLKVVKE